ncbi:MAG TPA: hypothetical protein VNS19_20425 [Acidimicrobiales bacterium]|nr:hypothetical protein [Acidimicrobiales bacterium]
MYRLRRIRPASVVLAVVVITLAVLSIRWLRDTDRELDDPPTVDGTGQPYVDALAARLVEPGAMWAGFTGLTEQQARCVALPWVTFVGADELEAAGFEPEDFARDPAGASAAAGLTWDDAQDIEGQYEHCGLDARTLLARAGITAVEAGGGRTVSLDQIVPCMAEKIDADDARRAFVLTLTQPDLGRAAPSGIPGWEAPPTVDADVNRALANAAAACA